MWTSERRLRVHRACDGCKKKKKQCSHTERSHTRSTSASRSVVQEQCIVSSEPVSKNEEQRPSTNQSRIKSPKRKFQPLEPAPSKPETPAPLDLPDENELPKDPAAEDETPIQNAGRLLQDGGGRLLYVGDSAALSFLQSIRRLVEGSLGASPFTTDPNRHKLVEASISTPPGYRHSCVLPDLETARYLTDSFFDNTVGLVEIFNRVAFTTRLLESYNNPLDADPQWLCQVNLVFAVGMQMRRGKPSPFSPEGKILERLEARGVKRAEIFYLTAKELKDPACDLEDGNFGAVQSLLLMTIFMLTAAKRNTAWAFLGMAVRLAYALGIHKEETLSIFHPIEQDTRRKLWQSLYIMDCFLSASLGRPSAITSGCVSELCPTTSLNQSTEENIHTIDLLASTDASKITGEILTRVYHKRKASRSIAYALSLRFSEWMKELPMRLHWRQILLEPENPQLTLKRLHINLIYFHGVILLTRPFLLYQISLQLKRTTNPPTTSTPEPQEQNGHSGNGKPEQMFCFHGACVRSAIHTITAVHAAFMSDALPKRDPFVIYYLFSATLVILANTFCCVYYEHDSETATHMALKVFEFCAEADLQARRYYAILKSFNDTLQASRTSTLSVSGAPDRRSIFNVLFGSGNSQTDIDLAAAENILFPGPLGEMGVNRTAASVQRDGHQYDNMGTNKMELDVPWPVTLPEGSKDAINFHDIWWSGGQDNFTLENDVQIPLYGLLENP